MKWMLLGLIICFYIFVSAASAWSESLTYDEPVHIQVGLDAWRNQTFTADPFSPPLIGGLAVFPQMLGIDALLPGSIPSQRAFPARMVILLLSVCLMIVVYVFVKKMIGEPEALTSVFLFAWEPSILAHNHYVTKDMGFALFFTLAYMLFVRILRTFSWKLYFFWVVSFGLMLSSKTSALPFFFVTVFLLFLLDPTSRTGFRIIWKKVLLGMVGALFVVWATYFFQTDVIIAKRDDVHRVSARLERYANVTNNTLLKQALWVGTQVPVPLGAYFASLKNGILLQRNTGITFFLGNEYKSVKWYFLPVHLFYKTPIPIFICIGYFLFLLWKKKVSLTTHAMFIAPVLGILIFLSISGVRPYVRYLLPIYPFVLILSAVALTQMIKRRYIFVPLILCAWFTIGTIAEYPHFISYANEFAGSDKATVTKLIDSDIDWGQGLFELNAYLKKEHVSAALVSYFGTDDAALYGLESAVQYGTYKADEICSLHPVNGLSEGPQRTIMSATNWHYCGYKKMDQYTESHIIDVISKSFLVFDGVKESLNATPSSDMIR